MAWQLRHNLIDERWGDRKSEEAVLIPLRFESVTVLLVKLSDQITVCHLARPVLGFLNFIERWCKPQHMAYSWSSLCFTEKKKKRKHVWEQIQRPIQSLIAKLFLYCNLFSSFSVWYPLSHRESFILWFGFHHILPPPPQNSLYLTTFKHI